MSTTLESIESEDSAASARHVGGKASTLLELHAAGFPVPEFEVSPPDLTQTIRRLGLPLAVRSSASCEDGRRASFAGQFNSYLNLRSQQDVSGAIDRCNASLTRDAVLAYCRQQRIDTRQLRMNVIVQRMVRPELAGVAFTVDPVTGDERVLIEATTGLADELLAGQTPPLMDGHPVLEAYRGEIESLARAIHRHFGCPQDVEFAIEDGEVYVLQSRPITRIHFGEQSGQWTNADFRDGGVSSDVCSPLMGSLYQLIWDNTLKESLRELRLYRSDFEASRMFYGRLYWNLGAVKDCLAALPGFVEREFDRDLSVQINYTDDGQVTPLTVSNLFRAVGVLASIKRFFRKQRDAAEDLMAIPASERLSHWDPTADDLENRFGELLRDDYVPIESTYFRTIFAASLAKLDFMGSFPDVDYTALVSALPPLDHVAPVRAVQAMKHRTTQAIEHVIDEHRHHYRRGLDIIHPRWDEDREFVRGMLRELPESAGKDPGELYQIAHERALKNIPRWKRRSFTRKLARLRHFLWLREQLRDYSNHVYHRIRQSVQTIGARRGIGDDVFFQTYQQLLRDDRDEISGQRETYQSYRHFRAPNEIGHGFTLGESSAQTDLSGIGASPGRIRARARIANNVEQASKLPRGSILVCPFTDPGWTAVLDRAGGVITETGGLLSHAAILCREYGIPAVLGVQEATRRITDGSEIEIDGSHGTVYLGPENEEMKQ